MDCASRTTRGSTSPASPPASCSIGRVSRDLAFELRPSKGLPRRVVAADASDLDAPRASLPTRTRAQSSQTRSSALPDEHRVFIEDPATPAPGADAFRWFFYAASPPWTNTRHSLTNVRSYQKEFLVKLRNVYSFFVIYANIDGFTPAEGNPSATSTSPSDLVRSHGYRPTAERSLLDRWILSELALTTRAVTEALDGYLLYNAAERLVDFVEALSNWYVRRGRARYWAPDRTPDKLDALFHALRGAHHVEQAHRPLHALLRRGGSPELGTQSLACHAARERSPHALPRARHFRHRREAGPRDARGARARFPRSSSSHVEQAQGTSAALARRYRCVRGRSSGCSVDHVGLIQEELNVHDVRFLRPGDEGNAVRYVLKPNFRALGPKLGKKVQLAKQVLAKADASALRATLALEGKVSIDLDGEPIELGTEEIEVAVEAGAGFAAAGGRSGVVVLHTALTEALRDEGLGREILSRLQGIRKELDLGFTERIRLAIDGSDRVKRIAELIKADVMAEVLAVELVIGAATFAGESRQLLVDGEDVRLVVVRSSTD